MMKFSDHQNFYSKYLVDVANILIIEQTPNFMRDRLFYLAAYPLGIYAIDSQYGQTVMSKR
tara:strand:- start:318 stop:500 length:183 start_codon:yes stop_codon:yes gene_type:complete